MTKADEQAAQSVANDDTSEEASTKISNQDTQRRYQQTVFAHFFGHTLAFLVALGAAVMMVYHYWHGEFGYYHLQALKNELVAQEQKNHEQQQINARLAADAHDLKSGLVAIEEHARLDLGLIKQGEVFVQIVPEASISEMPDVSGETDAVEVLDAVGDEHATP